MCLAYLSKVLTIGVVQVGDILHLGVDAMFPAKVPWFIDLDGLCQWCVVMALHI